MASNENRQQEESSRQKSSIDRVNDLVNKAKQVRNIRRGYKAFKAARVGGAVIEGGEAVGGVVAGGAGIGTVGTAAILILLIILLIVAIFMIIFGNVGNVNAGNQDCRSIEGICSSQATCSDVPNSQPEPNGICTDTTKPTCCTPNPPPTTTTLCQDLTPSNPALALKQDWNVVVQGTSDPDRLTSIYKILCSTNSSHYQSLLKTGGHVLYITLVSGTGVSYTNINEIRLVGFFNKSANGRHYLLLHESGHVISARNPRVIQSFPLSSLSASDSSCYDYNSTRCTGSLRSGYFLRSYPLRYYCIYDHTCWTGITARSESFAESLADSLSYDTYNPGYNTFHCSYGLPTFPTKCNNTYSWMKTNVLN